MVLNCHTAVSLSSLSSFLVLVMNQVSELQHRPSAICEHLHQQRNTNFIKYSSTLLKNLILRPFPFASLAGHPQRPLFGLFIDCPSWCRSKR